MYYIEHLQLALEQMSQEKEEAIADQNFDKAAAYRDACDHVKKALSKLPKPPESALQPTDSE